MTSLTSFRCITSDDRKYDRLGEQDCKFLSIILHKCFSSTQFAVMTQCANAEAQIGAIIHMLLSPFTSIPQSYSLKSSLSPIFLQTTVLRTPKIKFGPGSAYLLTLSEYRGCMDSAHRKASLRLVRLLQADVEPAVLLETTPTTLLLLANEIRISCRTKFLATAKEIIVRDLWYVLARYSDVTLPGRHGFSQ